MDNNNVTLIIPTYRNPKYLDLCLKSATENRINGDNHILVVVDGYVEESKSVLDKYPSIQYIELEQNHGMQYALNVGVMQATTKYVFIINDDNVLPTQWDVRLLEAFDGLKYRSDTPDRFVMTVDQIEPTGPGMFKFPVVDLGQDVESFKYSAFLLKEEHLADEEVRAEDDGHIFPFLMEKKYYLAVGGFDTFYNSPNVCDWDFFLKLELLGFYFPRTRALRLYHFGSVATKKNAESQAFREREAQAFAEYEWKWGCPPYNHPNTNSKIIKI